MQLKELSKDWLDGVNNYFADDIILWSNTQQQHDHRVEQLFTRLQEKNLTVNMHKLTRMYKILNNLASNYLRDHFEMSSVGNFYGIWLRNRKLCLVLPKLQTEYLKKSFVF